MVSKRELEKVRQIEKSTKSPFTQMMIPTGEEVCQIQLLKLMHRVHEVTVNEKEISGFLPAIFEELKDLDREELIKRFASIEFNRFLEYYRDAPDLNISEKSGKSASGERYRTGDRYFINLGKMDGLDKGGLLNLIDTQTGVRKSAIGKIELKGAYSFFEVDKSKSKDIEKGLPGTTYQGRKIRLELTEDGPKTRKKEKSRSSKPAPESKKGKHRKGRRY